MKGAHTDDAFFQNAEADLRVRDLDFVHRSRPILIDLKRLIERFANSTSLDDLFDSINQIYRDANQDPELKDWFKEVDAYIRKCLQEQGYIMQDASTDEWYVIFEIRSYRFADLTDFPQERALRPRQLSPPQQIPWSHRPCP